MLKPLIAFALLCSAAATAGQTFPPDFRRVEFGVGFVRLDETTTYRGTVKHVKIHARTNAGGLTTKRRRVDKPGIVRYSATAKRGRLRAKWEDGVLVKFRLRVRRRRGDQDAVRRVRIGLADVTSWEAWTD